MKKQFVDTRYARTPGYRKILEKIASTKKCPFCPENFVYHKHPVLKRRGNWFITRNFNPYPGAKHHFIVIGTRHKERLTQLTMRDFIEIGLLLQWTERTFKLQGGGMAMRFGNSRYTGATVAHIHCHLIVPKLEYRLVKGHKRKQRLGQVVSFPIG